MSETDGGDRIPVVSTVGDALEQLVFGRYARPYRWFVRALTALVVVLAAVHAARFLAGGSLGLTAGATRVLNLLTSAAGTLFVLAGVVQLLLFVRGVRRRETTVEAAAHAVEESAATVEAAAEELEDVVEEAAGDLDADVERAVEERTETAEERAIEAEETAEAVREELEDRE